MAHTTTDVHVEPGDRFDTYGLRSNTVGQSVYLTTGDNPEHPLNIHGDLAALLALADSLVAACWTLKTAADNAAAPYVPAGPPKTLRMPPHDPTGVRVKNDSAVVAAESAVEG